MPTYGERAMSKEAFLAKVRELRDISSRAVTDEDARAVTSQIAQLSRKFRIQNGIGLPETPLEQAQQLNKNYVTRPHIKYLSDEIAKAVRAVERGENQFLSVSMPPRMGKTAMTSFNTPLWLLRRHPDWKIVMSSYSSTLTNEWAGNLRRTIEDKPSLGIALRSDGGAQGRWWTMEEGGVYATTPGGDLTSRGARVLIIDDPIKDYNDAHTVRNRNSLWNWWLSTARTRLEQPYLVMVVMCMTGDTPVLRPDGSETPLRDIRPGDEIATYEDGKLSTSRVLNWANQGPDDIFTIKMESGRTVRANARHPFLTVNENGEEWVRTDTLKPGSNILTATGVNGGESSAQKTDASAKSRAEDSARRTTTKSGGRKAIVHRQPTLSLDDLRGSSIGTASQPRNTTAWLKLDEDSATSAERSPREDRHTGEVNSASTIITTLGESEDFSATTATSFSENTSSRNDFGQPLTTSKVIPDRVVSVTPAGREDVFDLQVERTENFIANGLVSHNTRWHEDDFIGRLESNEYPGDPLQWNQIRFPAIAETHDVLGREEGQPLYSPLVEEDETQALTRWADLKESVGTYTFASMYQQRPAPSEGAIFDAGWWRFWSWDPNKATEDGRVIHLTPEVINSGRWIDSWDATFKDGAQSDYVVGQRWFREGANRYLVAQMRGKWSFTKTIERMKAWGVNDDNVVSPFGHLVHERMIEDKANGPAIIDSLKRQVSGIKPINPRTSKEARARAITPEVESGNVYLPHPSDPGNEWVSDLLSELRNFPHDVHDDQVDALTQALSQLRDPGTGRVSSPNQIGQRRIERNVAQAANSSIYGTRSQTASPYSRRIG